jgi:pyrimidine-specific ribonucleoside hydrolase
MFKVRFLLVTLAAVSMIPGCTREKPAPRAVKIIFDTDFGPDYDDVGALAFLHAMADSGKAEILATLSSNKHPLVAPCLEILNTYFNRPDIPIGAPVLQGVSLGAWQCWPDTLVAKYPHKIRSTGEVPDAVMLYRKILNAQPDTSVTVVTVGFLTNLAGLLQSAPDSLSPLSGKDLVMKKVKKLVSMAGKFPSGSEFNVHMDSTASKYVFENWPTPVIFTGFEIGWKIHTGLRVMNMDVTGNPVRDVFRMNIPMTEEDKDGRASWDETAVLIAVYGTEGFFDRIRGTITVNADGSNGWINSSTGRHTYVVQRMAISRMAEFIEDRMMHLPVAHTIK